MPWEKPYPDRRATPLPFGGEKQPAKIWLRLSWGATLAATVQRAVPMHEYSIVASLLEKVAAEARVRGATSVEKIQVKIGELSGVEVDLLKTAFETFRDRSVCAAAELEIESIPARWACPGCAREIERGGFLRCPRCALPARLESGDEILLQRIEMEVA